MYVTRIWYTTFKSLDHLTPKIADMVRNYLTEFCIQMHLQLLNRYLKCIPPLDEKQDYQSESLHEQDMCLRLPRNLQVVYVFSAKPSVPASLYFYQVFPQQLKQDTALTIFLPASGKDILIILCQCQIMFKISNNNILISKEQPT